MSFLIHPNPASHTLYIEHSLPIVAYAIYDMVGRVVQQGALQGKDLDVSTLPEGMYSLVLSDRDGAQHKVEKIVVVR